MFTQICAHAYGEKPSNQKEFDWLMSMDAAYFCSAVCIGYQNSGNVDEKKMIEYGSFDNCGTSEKPVSCTKVHYGNSVNIRHMFEELVDLCGRNGFAEVVAEKTECNIISSHQECSDRPEDKGKPVGLICKEVENWRKPISSDLILRGLKEAKAKIYVERVR